MNRRDKIIPILLIFVVFIIIILFLGGGNFSNFISEIIPDLIVLCIVSFVLMIVPFLFRIFNKSMLEHNKGNIICLCNSVIMFAVFSIPNIITVINNEHNYSYSIDPVDFSLSLIVIYFIVSVIYYFINMSLFVNKK